MKPWHEFKSHDKKISTDSVSIDQELYEAIQLDARNWGMTKAAEIAYGCKRVSSDPASEIIAARDNKTL